MVTDQSDKPPTDAAVTSAPDTAVVSDAGAADEKTKVEEEVKEKEEQEEQEEEEEEEEEEVLTEEEKKMRMVRQLFPKCLKCSYQLIICRLIPFCRRRLLQFVLASYR